MRPLGSTHFLPTTDEIPDGDVRKSTRLTPMLGPLSILWDTQTFVRFRDDMIDDGFHVLGVLPGGQLSIRAGAFAHDPLDVRHLLLSAELIYLGRDKLEQFV
jgi:hypothetical protein